MSIVYLLLSVALIILLTARLQVHAFLALLFVAILFGLVNGMPTDLILASISDGFGGTLGKIGLIIVLGVIIGAFLENTGGAFALANRVLKIVGKNRVPEAMGAIGYFISIPVFADSGFLLMAPLNKSLSKQAGISLAGSAVALLLGLTATHCMVPPTPGPIAAAGILNADIGKVLMMGLLVSGLAMIPALIYVNKYVSKFWIDPNPDVSPEDMEAKLAEAPGALKSSMPVIIPIVLIVVKSIMASVGGEGFAASVAGKIVNFVGEPIIALIIGFFIALILPKKLEKAMLSSTGWVGTSLKDAATIILITGAGGIFGKMLQNSGIGDLLGESLSGLNLGIWLPFIIAAALKTAQGSSTVALITAASIMAPLMGPLGFVSEWDKALMVVAIGAGSMVVSHANDSAFWVLTQLSNMEVKTGYRYHTLGTFVLGLSAALIVYILFLLIH